MSYVNIRFYEELNFFLPKDKKKIQFQYTIYPRQTVKDLIEAIGIPHTEVDLILVNSNSVSFSYIPSHGDNISVYPVFESVDIKGFTRLRPEPLREIKFVLDVHLGKLTRKLRMLGFDSLYSNTYSDKEIAEISNEESRIVLTRDRELLKRSIISRGYILRSDAPVKQLVEVINRFDLKSCITPLVRCLFCNGYLVEVPKSNISHKLKPNTLKYFSSFKECNTCGKLYWKGSHYENMLQMLVKLNLNN